MRRAVKQILPSDSLTSTTHFLLRRGVNWAFGRPLTSFVGLGQERMSERRHEYEYFDLRTAVLGQTLAEVCSCRPGGVSNRIVASAPQPPTIGLHCALQCSPADRHAFLGQQVLAHHIRIAAMPNEPLAQPTLKAIQPFRPLR